MTPGKGLYFSRDQFPPELFFMISDKMTGSSPLFTPIAIVSAVPHIWIARSILLQSLAIWPEPALPA